MITEMLEGSFPPMPYLNGDVTGLIPDAMRGMKTAWGTWAKCAMSELDRVLSQIHTYGTSLTRALQPQHTEDEGVCNGFSQCARNFADATELRSALLRMKASSTGGLCGVTREHFSNAPDHVLEWVLEPTGGVTYGFAVMYVLVYGGYFRRDGDANVAPYAIDDCAHVRTGLRGWGGGAFPVGPRQFAYRTSKRGACFSMAYVRFVKCGRSYDVQVAIARGDRLPREDVGL